MTRHLISLIHKLQQSTVKEKKYKVLRVPRRLNAAGNANALLQDAIVDFCDYSQSYARAGRQLNSA